MDDTIGDMKKLTVADYQALAEFRYQIRKFLHFSDQAVEAGGAGAQPVPVDAGHQGNAGGSAAADSRCGEPDA